MPGEFQVIDIYRNLCQGLVSIEDVMMQDDQQVPQGTLVHDEKKPTTIINLLGHCKLEESMLEEVSTSFPAPSAGCTTVTEVPDQQLNTGTSPCHITNLDVYSGTDETLYDQENTDLKQEFTSMDDLMIAPGHEMDDVSDLLYFYATRDILSECKLLQISRDPMKWSKEDVARWLTHMCEKYGNLNVDLQCFNVDGSVLCRMTEDDFLLRSIYGCQIHAYLEIWKNCE